MSEIDVKAYLDQLRRDLTYVSPIPVQTIKTLHKKRDFGGIIKLIRRTMNVDVGLTVHWTSTPSTGNPNALAWIEIPQKMPYYGTAAFKKLKLDIFMMKPFVETKPYDEFAITVAHELSHVVLKSIEHPLRNEEKAVDLTAMLLGFSYLYRKAAHTSRWINDTTIQNSHLGYLSEREISRASKILVPYRMRASWATLKWANRAGWATLKRAKANAARLTILGVFAAVVAFVIISALWDRYQLALAEETRIQRLAPKTLDRYTTFVGAHAGFASVTNEYLVTAPVAQTASWNLGVIGKNIHDASCAANSAKIKKGLSYIHIYRSRNGDEIARFEVSSCP